MHDGGVGGGLEALRFSFKIYFNYLFFFSVKVKVCHFK